MTRLHNDPVDFKEEMIAGFVNAYGRYVKRIPNASGVMALDAPQAGEVSILIGGGSGHYPAFCGYVGPGLVDGCSDGRGLRQPVRGTDLSLHQSCRYRRRRPLCVWQLQR